METAISVSSTYIEISSDEDGESGEETLLTGLGSSVAVNLFEEFLHRSSIFGITDEDVRCMRGIFQHTSANFLNGGEFVPFMRGVLLRIKRHNVQQIVTEVYQCLRAEKIKCTSPNLPKTVTVTRTPSQPQTSPKQFDSDLEDAKRKLVNFFNRQASKIRGDQLPSLTLQKTNSPKALPTNGNDNTSVFTVHDRTDGGNITERNLQESPFNNGDINMNTHGKEQHMNNDIHSKKKRKIINVFDQHHSIPASSKLDCSASLTNLEKSKNGACSDYMNDPNSECRKDDGNDDNSDIIILSVIQNCKSAGDPHSSNITTVDSRPTFSTEEEIKASSDLEERKKRRQLLIKSIEKRLEFYGNEIKKLMTAELTLDEMNKEDSIYIKESKLKEKYCRLHEKLCKLQKSKHMIGNNEYLRIKIEGSPYPEINREADRYIQRMKRFPDFFDIKSVVCDANRKYNLSLKPQEEVDIAREVFSEVGDKLQKKRKREFTKYSGSFLTDQVEYMEDPALTDDNLRKKLKRNKKISKSNTEELFRHYSRLQYRGCENTCRSSEDEDIEKTVLEVQKKLSPMKVGQGKRENTATLPKGSPEVTSSNTTSHAIPSSTAVKEAALSYHAIQGALPEFNSGTHLYEVKSEWDGNSCQPKYSQAPYDHLSKDSTPSQTNVADKSPEILKGLNGNSVELDCKTESWLQTEEGLQVAKGDLVKLIKNNFNGGKYPEDRNSHTTPLSGGTTSNTIIVIESDDD